MIHVLRCESYQENDIEFYVLSEFFSECVSSVKCTTAHCLWTTFCRCDKHIDVTIFTWLRFSVLTQDRKTDYIHISVDLLISITTLINSNIIPLMIRFVHWWFSLAQHHISHLKSSLSHYKRIIREGKWYPSRRHRASNSIEWFIIYHFFRIFFVISINALLYQISWFLLLIQHITAHGGFFPTDAGNESNFFIEAWLMRRNNPDRQFFFTCAIDKHSTNDKHI